MGSIARAFRRRRLKENYRLFKKSVKGGNKTIKRELKRNDMKTNLATLGTLTIQPPDVTEEIKEKTDVQSETKKKD